MKTMTALLATAMMRIGHIKDPTRLDEWTQYL